MDVGSTNLAAARSLPESICLMVLLLANSALLSYGDDRKERTMRSVWSTSHVLLLAAMAFIMILSEGSRLDWSAVFLVDKPE